MFQWKEERKGDICQSILTSKSVIKEGIHYIEKHITNQAVALSQYDPKLFVNHYLVYDDGPFMDPIYPIAPKNVIIGDEPYEVYGFPCLVKTDEDNFEEIYIADGYLEKTYTLLIPVSTFIDEDEDEIEDDEEDEEEGVGKREKISFTIMGFAELPPIREDVDGQKSLEKLYYESLVTTQVDSKYF